MQQRRLRPTIDGRDFDENIVGIRLGVFNQNIEVAIVVKHAGIDQIKFRRVSTTTAVLFNKLRIRKRGLRIFVEIFHVGVRGCAIEVEKILFHVLAVITLAAC